MESNKSSKDADEISQHSDDGGSTQSPEHHNSDKSHSRSPTNSPSVGSQSPPHSEDEGDHSNHSRSESLSPSLRIDDEARSRANSASGKSHTDNDSDTDASMKSITRSRSRSGTRTPKSRAQSSRSRSQSQTLNVPSPKSRSKTPASREQTPNLQSPKSRSQTPKSAIKSPFSRSQSPIEKKNQKKKHKLISSESDSDDESNKISKLDGDGKNTEQSEKINAQDIFGDADDISDDDKSVDSQNKRSRSRSSSRHSISARSRSRSSSKYRSRSRSPPESSQPKEITKETENEVPETRIEVEVPRIVTNLGKEIHFVKLPNFLSVESRPFDAETYEDEIDEEETMDEEGRQRIKLKVSNTIRWRESMNNDGKMVKESNARFVRWSDGSHTLHLGNEMFDVYRQPLLGDHNHLFIRQGTGLQGQSVFRTKLTFRPHSTESFTHKKMTMSLADRSQKTSGIKILTQVGKDPTADRLFNLKKEEEKLRQATRSQHKAQPKKKKVSDVANSSYNQDDGSDDENAVSLSEIKNKYKKIARGPATSTVPDQKASAIYSTDDDDGSDFERRRKKIDKNKIVKALRDSDSESDDNVESDAESIKSKTKDNGSITENE